MKKIIVVILSFVLLLTIIILAVSNRNSDKLKSVSGGVFANPRQLGEFLLYGREGNKFIYYRPVEDIQNTEIIAKHLIEKIDFEPLKDKEIFDYDRKEIFVVENKDKSTDKIYQHVQIQYLKDWDKFIVFSAYEVNDFDDDFKTLLEQYEKQGKDMFGNEVNIIKLKEDMNCIHIKNTSPESLTYMYYKHDLVKNRITLVHTGGDEVMWTYVNNRRIETTNHSLLSLVFL